MMKMMIVTFLTTTVSLVTARDLPFPFGNVTGDIFTGPSNSGSSGLVALPKPMAYKGSRIINVEQYVNGYTIFKKDTADGGSDGYVDVYFLDIDTSNGGKGQNEVWLRVGSNTTDLTLAKDIISKTGKSFSPEAVIVSTWYKVEAYNQRSGPQNTFQLIMAYDESGTTWAIFAYAQLEYFESSIDSSANVALISPSRAVLNQDLFVVNSDATMNQLLSGTNCGIPGIYAYKVLQSTCGLLGLRIFCPFTFCGIFGRLLGLCNDS
jgi:Nidogen-like